ncbi:hypothetical protein BLA29_011605, partial [Euroglyphus maynei]
MAGMNATVQIGDNVCCGHGNVVIIVVSPSLIVVDVDDDDDDDDNDNNDPSTIPFEILVDDNCC